MRLHTWIYKSDSYFYGELILVAYWLDQVSKSVGPNAKLQFT